MAIFSFAGILINLKNKIIYFYALLLGIGISIKSYNLILILPLLFFFYQSILKNEVKKILYIFTIIFLPIILLNFFTHNLLGFILAPTNEDLAIAVIGNDSSRDIFWVLNNFIFYLGYLTLVCLPLFFFLFFH